MCKHSSGPTAGRIFTFSVTKVITAGLVSMRWILWLCLWCLTFCLDTVSHPVSPRVTLFYPCYCVHDAEPHETTCYNILDDQLSTLPLMDNYNNQLLQECSKNYHLPQMEITNMVDIGRTNYSSLNAIYFHRLWFHSTCDQGQLSWKTKLIVIMKKKYNCSWQLYTELFLEQTAGTPGCVCILCSHFTGNSFLCQSKYQIALPRVQTLMKK